RPRQIEHRGAARDVRRRPPTIDSQTARDLRRLMSQHGRILLVDHSRGAMLFQETILRRRGTSVTTALAGSEGLVKARAERPHLIILGFDLFDMTAPEKDGRVLRARSVNLSANGMLLEVDRVLPGEGRVRLHFFLPGDARPLQLDGEVLRAEFAGAMAKYGVRFVGTSDGDRERIEQ